MPVEARRVVVEQPRDIGRRQSGDRAIFEKREPRSGALRVRRVRPQRLGVGRRGAGASPSFSARLPEREPGGRPVRRAFERLFEHFRRRTPIAVRRRRLRIGVAALGERVRAGETVRGHFGGG